MKKTDLYNAISDINPEYLEEINETRKQKKHISKKSFIAILCAVIGVFGITAYAATNYDLGLGFRDMEITPSQGQELVEKDAAIIYSSTPDASSDEDNIDYSNMAVTSNDVTISPDAVIVDERYAYISFRVSGYKLDEPNTPFIEHEPVYDKEHPDKSLDCEADFYLVDSSQEYPYEKYYAEDGNLYYRMYIGTYDMNDTMLGKTVQIHINRIGDDYKCETVKSIDGNWDFEIKLPTGSTSIHMDINTEIDENFFLDSIEISPISMQLNYTVNGVVNNSTIPYMTGFIMKDGSKQVIANIGHTYTSSGEPKAYCNSYFSQYIDYSEIDSLIFVTLSSMEEIVVPID
ncbi:MAG: DUF4179 domain-containing protein [Saccharofermentans sp.]|nr:DUF4179 domain-containing protein [Saccharofermentans sp.]